MPAEIPSRPACVALLSGGLDSCVALACARVEHGSSLAVLHAGYGQRTAVREQAAAGAIAEHYGLAAPFQVDLSHLGRMGSSSLTDRAQPVPHAEPAHGGVPTTYVPFRNANLLAAGVAWAEALGAAEVWCGAHAPGSSYPDTQPPFFTAFEALIRQGTAIDPPILVRVPLLELDKAAIVRRGVELGAPLHLTWSCYERDEEPCRRCHSCRLRAAGFAGAGHPDPLERTARC